MRCGKGGKDRFVPLEGGSLRLISQHLGRASLETMLIYMHLTPLNEAQTHTALVTLPRAVAA